MKKNVQLLLLGILSFVLLACESNNGMGETNTSTEGGESSMQDVLLLSVNSNEKYQNIESIGASGSWWSQDVGGWTDNETEELTKREYIAELLFDKDKGIGLSSYRYNLGGGSTEENSPKITDPWRRAESFEVEPGVYDWSKDANSQWMLKEAVKYGLDDIYLFVNSPLTRLTKNGSAYGDMVGDISSNLDPDNYQAFAKYVYDVTEYFIDEGIPVTHVSPINEPQWEWIGGQEGNHYEPQEMVDTLKTFIDEKETRNKLSDVHLSMPELGEWGESSYAYYDAMIADETIMDYFNTWEIHSYWTSALAKEDFTLWYQNNNLDVELKMTEWTEMVNGRDYTMDSALNLANQIYEDMTILDVTVWQYWIAVSTYDYRDGLIYVDLDTQDITIPKRLWTMGNFSKFIRPGYTRVESQIDDNEVNTVSFLGTNDNGEDETVIVLINNSDEEKEIALDTNDLTDVKAYITDNENDLKEEEFSVDDIVLPAESVVTLVGRR